MRRIPHRSQADVWLSVVVLKSLLLLTGESRWQNAKGMMQPLLPAREVAQEKHNLCGQSRCLFGVLIVVVPINGEDDINTDVGRR